MADPIDPTQTAESLNATTVAANKASDALGSLNGVANTARNVFASFQNQMSQTGMVMKANQDMTQNQAAAFGILSVSVLGARKAFDNLNGIDTSSLDTFSKQWKDLSAIIDASPLTKAAKESNLLKILKDFGANSVEAKKAAEQGSVALSHFANSFFESADNGLRLQNAMVQIAAKTGDLDKILTAAGPNLSKMNYLLSDQQKALTESSKATGLSAEVIEQYYTQLGTVPGALNATVTGSNMAGKSVSMLTAAIEYAKGSGRNFTDVMEDLKVAFRDYNLTGEEALKFTARMGELSNKFHVELSDVQGSLRETAGLFKMFGNEAEGAAKMMNSYLGELEKTGISGKTALDVMNGVTQGIKGMSIAQKSFLSAQTGGSGGLMGGFQIEKMLRDGKIDEVFDKVRQQMSKSFGSIATLDDAQNSPQAAAQLQKQMLMLQQGPLGKFAKDDQSAMRLLEAFKTRDAGGPMSDLSKTIVQDKMGQGVDLQEKSLTELSKIRELIQETQGFSGIANLTTAQHGLTAGVGARTDSADFNSEMRSNMRESSREAGMASGKTTSSNAQNILNRTVSDKSDRMAFELAENYGKVLSEMGPALMGPINKIKDLFSSGDANGASAEYQNIMKDIEEKKKELKNAPAGMQATAMQSLSRQEADVKSMYATLAVNNGNMDAKTSKTLDMNMDFSELGVQGSNVSRAATRSANAKPAVNNGNVPAASGEGNAAPQQNLDMTVTIEHTCPDCGERKKGDSQSYAVNPAQKARK